MHLPGVVTVISETIFPCLEAGLDKGSAHTGSLIQRLDYQLVNRICYERVVPRAPETIPDAFATATAYMEKRQWVEDFRIWREETVPACQARNSALKETNLRAMSNRELADHFSLLIKHWGDAAMQHHIPTFPYTIANGHFLVEGERLSGASAASLMQLFQGTSSASRGPWRREWVSELRAAFKADPEAKLLLEHATSDEAGLAHLVAHHGPAGQALAHWMKRTDHFVTQGYDASGATYAEVPHIVLAGLRDCILDEEAQTKADEALKARVAAHLTTILAGCKSDEDRAEFQKIYAEALSMIDWRDERGLYNDAQVSGLVRLCLREVWNRLPHGRVPRWDWLLDCHESEVIALLLARGDQPELSELRLRRHYRLRRISSPPVLGDPPQPPPDPSGLPPGPRALMTAMHAVMSHLLPEPPVEREAGPVVRGKSGNPGSVTATARVLLDPSEWNRVKKGDIAVVQFASSSFNVILPLVSAIVADFGGILTHACICAREFGIPCVVATNVGTQVIKDGSTITVDGTLGTVTIH